MGKSHFGWLGWTSIRLNFSKYASADGATVFDFVSVIGNNPA
jgi:hypothetical protein